ncbi:MAG: Uma2 family endonuclease, partial [Elainellaceae cyanobacterium]
LEFDLNVDPPPDLALEIDLTSKSLDRLPIYQRLGIPELWCYENSALKIYQLQENGYIETEGSAVFPRLKIRELPQLIKAHRSEGRLALRRAIRDWVREQVE